MPSSGPSPTNRLFINLSVLLHDSFLTSFVSTISNMETGDLYPSRCDVVEAAAFSSLLYEFSAFHKFLEFLCPLMFFVPLPSYCRVVTLKTFFFGCDFIGGSGGVGNKMVYLGQSSC